MQQKIEGLFKKKVEVRFTEENTSSDGGLLLVKQVLDGLKIVKGMKGALHDPRNQDFIEHPFEDLLSQRLYQLMAGYEDLNDADSLKNDPLFQLLVKNEEIDKADKALASSPTLCRLEKRVTFREIEKLAELQVDLYLQRNRKRWKKAIKKKNLIIRLDLDPTDIATHGEQQLSLFNGYYGHRCYLPMILADGDNGDLITAFLRPGTKHAKFLLVYILKRLFAKIETLYPFVCFELRADSGFQCSELFEFLDGKSNVSYTVALMSNAALDKGLKAEVDVFEQKRQAAVEQKLSFEDQKVWGEFGYKADSWRSFRRVVYQIDVNSHRVDLRYYVSNDLEKTPQQIKENYNQRANIENRIKELKTQAGAKRLSCESFAANSFRFQLACFSLIVFQEMKKKLQGTELEASYIESLRLKLLKVAVRMEESTRRILLFLPKSYPYQNIWNQLLAPG